MRPSHILQTPTLGKACPNRFSASKICEPEDTLIIIVNDYGCLDSLILSWCGRRMQGWNVLRLREQALYAKEARERLEEMFLTNLAGPNAVALEEYEAVPFELCGWHANGKVHFIGFCQLMHLLARFLRVSRCAVAANRPAGVRGAVEKDGPKHRHSGSRLLHGVLDTAVKGNLANICLTCDVRVERFNEKRTTDQSRLPLD